MTNVDELFEMAKGGTLPPDFNMWDLADNDGWSVAHVAAGKNTPPPDFNQWGVVDKNGWAVAHQAAVWGNLPHDFNQWDLKDRNDQTVKEVYEKYKK